MLPNSKQYKNYAILVINESISCDTIFLIRYSIHPLPYMKKTLLFIQNNQLSRFLAKKKRV